MNMALFDFERDGARCRVAYPLPGTLTRLTQRIPENCPAGYLHLYEHMVMRANVEVFEQLQRIGHVTNAVTTADEVSFYILSPAGAEVPDAALVLGRPFTAHQFEVECRTVLQERRLTPEGDPGVDRVLGTEQDIDAFSLANLHYVRALLGPPDEIVYSAGHSAHAAADPRPVVWPLGQNRVADHALGVEAPVWGRLLSFFQHMVDVASPEPLTWAEIEASRTFIRDHKADLLFRYELAVTGLKKFDEEFARYHRTVGLSINVARTFEELPWEDLLRFA